MPNMQNLVQNRSNLPAPIAPRLNFVAALAFTCSALARIEWRRWQAADGRGGA